MLAKGLKPLYKGAIPKAHCREDMLNGKVMTPLRSGLIVAKSENGTVLGKYEFGIALLLNKK